MKQPIPTFKGTVLDDKTLKMFEVERRNMARWVATFPAGTELIITIQKRSEKRTLSQNNYYWGVIIPTLGNHIGCDSAREMSSILEYKFNPIPSKLDPNVMIGGSTADLGVEGFSNYINTICRWAATDLGCYIPEPEGK